MAVQSSLHKTKLGGIIHSYVHVDVWIEFMEKLNALSKMKYIIQISGT